ncbi:phospholipase D family protein [Kribbella sp. NPDC050281]|uniref:phospholipase D family protein n=1 Tax=Kribbella sp. NPDC050281 TaxID=3155515 RepID=UPI0033FA5177
MDVAVATTYSLDLTSLVLAPLAMAAYEQADLSSEEKVDAVALLEAVRRYAEKTTVFCQAGAIHVPSSYRRIMAFAEDCIVEVKPRAAGRIFHPKIWVLRFASPDGAYSHRLVCLSRNLTGDQSWDTVLQLDEQAEPSGVDTEPLTDFLADLPELAAAGRLSSARQEQLADLRSTLSAVQFEIPPPFTELEFWPLGAKGGRDWPLPEKASSLFVISPFLDAWCLSRLPGGTAPRLLSRSEMFDRVGANALPSGTEALVMQSSADSHESDAVSSTDLMPDAPPETSLRLEFRTGLHAKTFIWDDGPYGRIFTGSANATRPAFNGNVEFNVLLAGPRASCGVDAVLDDRSDSPSIMRLLQRYEPKSMEPTSDAVYQAERDIEFYHASLVAAGVTLSVIEISEHRYRLEAALPTVKRVGQSTVWPVSLPRDVNARSTDEDTSWGPIGIGRVTPFLAVETTIVTGSSSVTRASVLKAELLGDPVGRHRMILREMLTNERDIIRYLAYLLGDPALDSLIKDLHGHATDDNEPASWRTGPGADDLIIFEPLVRAAGRADGSLARANRLLAELRDDHGSIPHVSAEFEQLWSVIWAATEGAAR